MLVRVGEHIFNPNAITSIKTYGNNTKVYFSNSNADLIIYDMIIEQFLIALANAEIVYKSPVNTTSLVSQSSIRRIK